MEKGPLEWDDPVQAQRLDGPMGWSRTNGATSRPTEMGVPNEEVVELAVCGAQARMSKSFNFTHRRIDVLSTSNPVEIVCVCVGTAIP